MIVDANLLIYTADPNSPRFEPARAWIVEALNGTERIGLPWATLGAFLRITTHPGVFEAPLAPSEAAAYVDGWLNAEPTWIPPADEATWHVYRDLAQRHEVRANLVPDAQLAAIALRHGVAVASTDRDFSRFPEVRWIDPLA